MRGACLALLAIPVAFAAGAADFEGVLRSRMSGAGEEGPASGTAVMYVSPAGIRMEVRVKVRGSATALTFTSLVLHERPRVSFALDEARKTYREQAIGAEALQRVRAFRVQALGHEKVAGHDCLHVALTDEAGERFELWTTQELGSAERFWSAQARGAGSWGGMYEALHLAGADGWPLRWTEGQRGATWETTAVERRVVPPALFDLRGYAREEPRSGKPAPEPRDEAEDPAVERGAPPRQGGEGDAREAR